ncbi:MAG: hypothetical protein ABIP53_09105 [Candidatus Limnocylindrales bacterium]
MAGFGYQGSAEELARAYTESYAAEPDANATKFVTALAPIEVDSQIPLFTAWLMLVDGFLPPHAGDQEAFLATGLARSVAAGTRRGMGVARNRVARLTSQKANALTLIRIHLVLVVRRSGIRVSSAAGSAHEGHGGNGASVTFTATISSNAGRVTAKAWSPGH